jgi:uncharacterized membrane protein
MVRLLGPLLRYIFAVPIVGMMLGNAISAIGVGVNSVHKEFA